jgi:hypothetical protein
MSMIDAKKNIKLLMSARMESAGWPLLEMHALPPFYGKELPVTPYFRCSDIVKRPYGKYVVEGLIGVVHQEFETAWLANPNREPQGQGFGMGLHLANFNELGPKMYLPCDDPTPHDLAEFCTAVAQILSDFPSDEMQLVNALEANKLRGFPFNAFAGYSYRNKFDAFVEFLRRRSKDLRN